MGLFRHCSRRLIVLLPPNEFLHSSPEAPRIIQAGETSAIEGRNYYPGIQLAKPEVLCFFTCRKVGTWDRFFHFLSEGRYAEDYSDIRKIQRFRLGSNPRTTTPQKPLSYTGVPQTTQTFWVNCVPSFIEIEPKIYDMKEKFVLTLVNIVLRCAHCHVTRAPSKCLML